MATSPWLSTVREAPRSRPLLTRTVFWSTSPAPMPWPFEPPGSCDGTGFMVHGPHEQRIKGQTGMDQSADSNGRAQAAGTYPPGGPGAGDDHGLGLGERASHGGTRKARHRPGRARRPWKTNESYAGACRKDQPVQSVLRRRSQPTAVAPIPASGCWRENGPSLSGQGIFASPQDCSLTIKSSGCPADDCSKSAGA
jgi:hypothetical protein